MHMIEFKWAVWCMFMAEEKELQAPAFYLEFGRLMLELFLSEKKMFQ